MPKLLNLILLFVLACATAEETRVTTPTQTRIDNRRPPTNWGKSYGANRGVVEYVRLKFPEPRDVTLYLGAPRPGSAEMWFAPNFVVSVGSGGTTFDYVVGQDPSYGTVFGIASSGRGVTLHFCADELYVRGETTVPGGLPPAVVNALRFNAQAGLGTPSTFERMNPIEVQGNGNADLAIQLTPWSTHARVIVGWDPATHNPISGFTVRQESVSPFGTTVVVETMPLTLTPFPLHPNATQIVLTTTGGGGPPPAGPGAGAVYFFYLAETVVY